MFNADDIVISLSKDQIFEKISEYDIWKYYCKNFEEINKSFCSELYNDRNPSCRIQQLESGMLIYKDFGTGDTYTCFKYIMTKFGCNYHEALVIISNDFGLLKTSKIALKPSFILGREELKLAIKPRVKSTISILARSWNLGDYNYWSKYGISFDLLESYNVYPCKHVYLHKDDKTIIFTHTNSNPIYAYRFTGEDKYSYKIYKPLEPNKKYKWLFSGGSSTDIEGMDQLPLFGELLIITKSLKDCMVYSTLGYSAISLQGEGNKLDNQLVTKLLKRFTRIVVQYDNDEQGEKSAYKLQESYNFSIFTVPPISKCKDLAEYKQKYGFKETLRMVMEDWGLKPEKVS